MKSYIITTSIGFIAIENSKIIDYELFSDNSFEYLLRIDNNEVLDIEETLIERLSKKYDEIVIETSNVPSAYLKYSDVKVEESCAEGKYLRNNFDELIREIPEFDNVDLTEYIHDSYMSLSSEKITESIKTNDVMIIESVNSLEELEETTGKLIERLREWTISYLPELDKISNHELYAKLIAYETSRENIRESSLLENTDIILDDDFNVVLPDEDLGIIRKFACSVLKNYEARNELEKYIHEKIVMIAPNLNDVAGSNLSAKLIAHCNGLESLAKLPSSTVQIIGAEKAIFRHLKTGENPPKHGLIFQHPSIRGSNWWIRGKLARAVANSISIAARKDAFSSDYDEGIKLRLDEKIDKIKKDHPFPERRNKKNNKTKNRKDKKNKKERKKKKNRVKKLRKEEYYY